MSPSGGRTSKNMAWTSPALILAFFETALVAPAKSNRLKAINVFSDGTIAAIFATLGSEAISVVSMRPASKYERKLYEQSLS